MACDSRISFVNSYHIMGKNKKDKSAILQKKTQKIAFKSVLQSLAEQKDKFEGKIQHLAPVTGINHTSISHRPKKLNKKRKPKPKSEDSDQEEVGSRKNTMLSQTPQINIFAVNNYEAENYVPLAEREPIPTFSPTVKLSIEDIAKKQLGSQMHFEKFGEKPLKNKQKQQQPMEEQPNKDIFNHPELELPAGKILVERPPELATFRDTLPILMKEQQIVEMINFNLVTLICGQTGSGKSTQLPQFLYQKNYPSFGKIAVTQPRRLAAIALAQRVAEEMGVELGKEVSYQVRHQRMEDTDRCQIKFMTDGILLNEMVTDFLLLKYSVVIIDQAHQRKVNTDLLIGLLSQVIKIREKMSKQGRCHPLRLVIMSATLRIEDFRNESLFSPLPPIAKVQARMFPVTNFFSKITPEDYVTEAVSKCVKIHKRLPPGDVLVFLTGKEEIEKTSILLAQALERIQVEEEEEKDNNEDVEENFIKENQNDEEIQQQKNSCASYCILQLYSTLPLAEQRLIFQPSSHRKFILSTNIAETSLTIPNIRYVVDCGHEKYKHFDKIWRWYKGWASRATAQQRAGRAGRVSHGYCYRLYSTAVFTNTMKQFPQPEISKIPLENTILQLKAIGVQDTLRFPFPTRPQRELLAQGINKLLQMKAVEGQPVELLSTDKTKLTELGRVLSFIPLEPMYGKMLLMGRNKGIPQYMLFCVLALTVETVLAHSYKNIDLQEMEDKDEIQQEEDDEFKNRMKRQEMRKKLLRTNVQLRKSKIAEFKKKYSKFYTAGSDIFLTMNIIGEFFQYLIKIRNSQKHIELEKQTRRFCSEYGLIQNAMRDIYRNGEQIIEIYETLTNQKLSFEDYVHPQPHQTKCLLDIFLESYPKNIAQLQEKASYKSLTGLPVNLHPSSYLYSKTPLYVGYFETFQTSRVYLKYPFQITNYSLMASFGKILPVKNYVWDRDKGIAGIATGLLGQFEIPSFKVLQPEGDIVNYQIARLLLDGVIFDSLKKLKPLYNADPKIIRPENVSEKVQRVVNVIRAKGLEKANKQGIKQHFKNPLFLKAELKLWITRDGFQMADYDGLYEEVRKSILRED